MVPQVGGEGKGVPRGRDAQSPQERGEGWEPCCGSWIRTPKHPEVADRQLEEDLGIEVTGIKKKKERKKSCSKT